MQEREVEVALLGEALSIIAAILRAASNILAAKALKDLNPLSVNALKISFAAVSMLPFVLVMGAMQSLGGLSFYGLFWLILAAIVGFGFGDMFFFKSITIIGVSRSSTVAYSFPLFTIGFAVAFLAEPFSLTNSFGAGMILLGIMLSLAEASDESNCYGRRLQGISLAFATAISWSIGSILFTLSVRDISVVLANAIRYTFLSSLFLPIFAMRARDRSLRKKDLVLIALSGILDLTIAGLAFLLSLQLIGASKATPLSATSPVWACLMSKIFLREKVTLRIIASSIAVVIGIFLLT
jgi:drug/metabolite transporter (DMT)-like permease